LESKDAYLLRAELPGMNKEDFNLEVKNGILTISGERKLEEPVSGAGCGEVLTIVVSASNRQQDGIQATYCDGILEIYCLNWSMPKPGRSR
jgi:HSP20 family protein